MRRVLSILTVALLLAFTTGSRGAGLPIYGGYLDTALNGNTNAVTNLSTLQAQVVNGATLTNGENFQVLPNGQLNLNGTATATNLTIPGAGNDPMILGNIYNPDQLGVTSGIDTGEEDAIWYIGSGGGAGSLTFYGDRSGGGTVDFDSEVQLFGTFASGNGLLTETGTRLADVNGLNASALLQGITPASAYPAGGTQGQVLQLTTTPSRSVGWATAQATNVGPDNGVTIIGLTNASSPLFFPFMGYTYAARFVVVSEAWDGLTNGVVHWRGDGANPNATCVSPREFWFQTNLNWAWIDDAVYADEARGALIWSNDVGRWEQGHVDIDVQIDDANYTNSLQVVGGIGTSIGSAWWKIACNVSNGTTLIYSSSDNRSVPFISRLVPVAASDGSILLFLTNDSGYNGGYSGAWAERVQVHCAEITTGTNWPYH